MNASHPASVVDIIKEAPDVRRLVLTVDDTDSFPFLAGQHVLLRARKGDRDMDFYFSIASNPRLDNHIEFIISGVESKDSTRALFEVLESDARCMLSDADGTFNLPEELPQEICFIATGSGLGPLRSMLWDVVNKEPGQHRQTLIFGCRHEEDLLCRKEFEQLQSDEEGFTFAPVLSAGNWDGYQGRVHDVYQNLFADGRPVEFYMCGSPAMMEETEKNLLDMGYESSNIHYEKY